MHGFATQRTEGQAAEAADRVLLIPGLDGDPRLLSGAASRLFPGRRALPFSHLRDPVEHGLAGLAEGALAVLDADPGGDAPAFVCGESFGGTVALTLARRHPERVRGLILLSTFGWYPAGATRAARLGLIAWELLGDRVAGRLIRLWRPISVPGALGLRCPPEIRRVYLGRPAPHLGGYRAKSAIALEFDARPWLGEIASPTLILIGTRDPVVPPSAGRDLARRIPNARLHVLPGGHLAHIVRAEQAGGLIASWIREIEQAGYGQREGSVDRASAPEPGS